MKKIMFNDSWGLTQAVLDGRKTNTRRIISESAIDNANECRREYFDATFDNMSLEDMLVEGYKYMDAPCFSRYKVGEDVAVAQAYKNIESELPVPISDNEFEQKQAYHIYGDMAGWHNKMFTKPDLLPHRIKITNIRVERLQDISEEDCLKEGIKRKNERYVVENEKGVCFYTNDARLAFRCLIDKTCGKGTWERNPWVFVYEFELIKCMAKRNYKWHRWNECLPEVEPDGCSEFVEVCHNGCYPQIACWNTNSHTPFWQTNSFKPLFSKKDLKIVKQDEVWWRYIEYPKE